MATLNVAMKVNRAITGATTVGANCFAVVTYTCTGTNITGGGSNAAFTGAIAPTITRFFGPSQAIPATISAPVYEAIQSNNFLVFRINGSYSLSSGVEIVNTQ